MYIRGFIYPEDVGTTDAFFQKVIAESLRYRYLRRVQKLFRHLQREGGGHCWIRVTKVGPDYSFSLLNGTDFNEPAWVEIRSTSEVEYGSRLIIDFIFPEQQELRLLQYGNPPVNDNFGIQTKEYKLAAKIIANYWQSVIQTNNPPDKTTFAQTWKYRDLAAHHWYWSPYHGTMISLPSQISRRKCMLYNFEDLRLRDPTHTQCVDKLLSRMTSLMDVDLSQQTLIDLVAHCSKPKECAIHQLTQTILDRKHLKSFKISNYINIDQYLGRGFKHRDQPHHTKLGNDLFLNPFRTYTFDSSNLTPTTTTLAQTIYHDRRFDLMPILGDALEEAGCTDQSILTHCRRYGPHFQGCWVLDWLLGLDT